MVGPSVRIATYNIHGCVGIDRVVDPDRIATVLRQIDADVVGLQEVDCRRLLAPGCDQLEVIARLAGYRAIAGPALHDDDGHFGNALLTRVPIARIAHHDVSVRGREPRAILDVTLADESLRVLVTHFGLRASERRRQVETLLELAQPNGARLAVLGDFNEWRPRWAALFKLHEALGRARAIRSFPSVCPLFALDRIWVWPRASVHSVRAHRSRLARLASDHLPVVATLDP